ncbi:MAG: GGDEF domain-containing protein [Planctomycetota bacterium]
MNESRQPIIAATLFPDILALPLADFIKLPIQFVSIDDCGRRDWRALIVGPDATRADYGRIIRAWYSEGDNRPLLACPVDGDIASWLEGPEMDRIVWNTLSVPPGPRDRRIVLRALESANSEIGRLRDSLAALEVRNRGLVDLARQLRRDATTCPLTGVFNRRAIEGLLDGEVSRRSGLALAVGLVDIDRFREANKRHLHTGGDIVIRGVAEVISTIIRESDAIGRIGGDEFLIIARGTGMEGATALATRIRQSVTAARFDCPNGPASASVSIGFAVAEGLQAVSAQSMRDLAAKALLDAKEAGRDRAVIRFALSPQPEGPAPA